jgi:uncharacterized protein YyaL (SSP411 family)
MEQTTYARPDVVRTIVERTVPIKVDADRRPDVNDRYNLDGWPTTALLTPSGEILTGSTYVTPDFMLRMLTETADALEQRYDELMTRAAASAKARRHAAPANRYEIDAEAPDWVATQILGQHDSEHGGFGTAGKFLQLAPLRFALARYVATRQKALGDVVRHSLTALLASPMVDDIDGGVFRYAAARDWSRPHTEKMLEDQAGMTSLLLDAAGVFDMPDWVGRARDVMRFVERTLCDRSRGGFFASQRADDEYHSVSGSIRQTMEPPVVDRTLFTDLNAQAAVAWLRAGAVLDDLEPGRLGLMALERVLLTGYRPGDGVAHYVAGRAETRGLLTDHVHAAWALLDFDEATGNETYGMLAEELMRTAIRTLWDSTAGGFFDRQPDEHDVGLLSDPLKPLALNCLAARTLHRLAARTGQQDLEQFAREALASQTGVYRAQGIGGAPYALAVLELDAPA